MGHGSFRNMVSFRCVERTGIAGLGAHCCAPSVSTMGVRLNCEFAALAEV